MVTHLTLLIRKSCEISCQTCGEIDDTGYFYPGKQNLNGLTAET